jgi:hypothetical protein
MSQGIPPPCHKSHVESASSWRCQTCRTCVGLLQLQHHFANDSMSHLYHLQHLTEVGQYNLVSVAACLKLYEISKAWHIQILQLLPMKIFTLLLFSCRISTEGICKRLLGNKLSTFTYTGISFLKKVRDSNSVAILLNSINCLFCWG